MATEKKSFFWASYADLMTSLFFVMLTLFIVACIDLVDENNGLKQNNKELQQQIKQIEKGKEINNATANLDSIYFKYHPKYKKHELKVRVQFPISDASMNNIPTGTKEKLKKTGKILQEFINSTIKKYSDTNIQYLLIIEGQASRDKSTHNYELSYQRALALKKFWEENNIRFDEKNCEVLICGSGDGRLSGTGLMRESDEVLNQRFLIHILPKPGKIED